MSAEFRCTCGLMVPSAEVLDGAPCPNCGKPMSIFELVENASPPTNGGGSVTPQSAGTTENAAAENMAAFFNNLTPEAAEQLARAFRPDASVPVWVPLLLGLPLAALFLNVVGMIFFSGEPLGGLVCPSILAAVFVGLTLWGLHDRWTLGRGVWCATLLGFFAMISYNVVSDKRQEQEWGPHLQPLVNEFQDFEQLPDAPPGTKLGGAVFSLVRIKKGVKEKPETPPALQPDFDLYRKLPATMRIGHFTDDVKTVIIVDWWWKGAGAYVNRITGNTGGAHIGTCNVTIIDRPSRTVLARTHLVSETRPPENKRTAMEWYGPQPDETQIVHLLELLAKGERPASLYGEK